MIQLSKNSAVVLIEFQKQWTERGFYNWLIRNQLKKRNVVDNAKVFVRKLRECGVSVVHAPLVVDPRHKKGWLAWLTAGRIFTKNTWKAELTPDLFAKDDPVVQGRTSFDAFVNSDLDEVLKKREIQQIYFCGFATDKCVGRTMRTAQKKGYDCFLVSDCTATFNEVLQRWTEKRFQGKVVTSLSLISSVQIQLR